MYLPSNSNKSCYFSVTKSYLAFIRKLIKQFYLTFINSDGLERINIVSGFSVWEDSCEFHARNRHPVIDLNTDLGYQAYCSILCMIHLISYSLFSEVTINFL